MTDLKPCPFCGGKLIRDGLGQYWMHEIKTTCIFRGLLTRDELQKWNNRHPETNQGKKLDIAVYALESIFEILEGPTAETITLFEISRMIEKALDKIRS